MLNEKKIDKTQILVWFWEKYVILLRNSISITIPWIPTLHSLWAVSSEIKINSSQIISPPGQTLRQSQSFSEQVLTRIASFHSLNKQSTYNNIIIKLRNIS